jgi:lipopolysaccharide export system permease protein
MAYVLPFGMLTATLLTFGRVSADQELTAVRAGGISLVALVTPILLLGVFLSGLCGLFNLWIAPECRSAYKNLIFQVGMQTADSLITEDRFIVEIPGVTLYMRKREGNIAHDVQLYTIQNNQIASRISADRGEILWDKAGRKISFKLIDPLIEARRKDDPDYDRDFVGPPSPEPLSEWVPVKVGAWETDPIDLTSLTQDKRKPKLSEMNIFELVTERAARERQGISTVPIRAQMNRQISFSFACFGFTLVGIPLAIRAHRRETSIGVAIALGLVLVYYAFFIMGDALSSKEHLHPELIVWIPNFLFQSLGALLLWRANRRG